MLRRNTVYRTARLAWFGYCATRRYRALEERARPHGEPSEDSLNEVHEHTARELHDLTLELEGLYIKLAQVIGARQDLAPEPYVRWLARFHDRVPPRPFRTLERGLRRALGQPVARVFSHIDPEPLASASLAQVHRARLRGGSDVVLKIQYPEIENLVRVDLAGLRRLARRAAGGFGGILDSEALLEETAHFLELELDFEREAASTERIGADFRGDERVRVPRVYRQHCSRKLLVLEFLEGTPLTDLDALAEHCDDLPRFAERIAQVFATMIFDRGFFHGDPHPGNLLLLPGGVVGLLDFGLAKELPQQFGPRVASMFLHGLTGDRERALEAARSLGFNVDELSPALLAELVQRTIRRREEDTPRRYGRQHRLERERDRRKLRQLSDGGSLLRIPSHFALIGRTLMLLNGLSERLAPGQRLVQQTIERSLATYAAGSTATPSGFQRSADAGTADTTGAAAS